MLIITIYRRMPDFTIPAALLVTIMVITITVMSFFSGNYQLAAITGTIGTVFNLICFYNRFFGQLRAEIEDEKWKEENQKNTDLNSTN
jgi:hypothetical protein